MPILNCTLQGRFGNQAMIYLYARAMAERTGCDFRCDDWIGNRIFDLDTPVYDGPPLRRANERELNQWSLLQRSDRHDIEFRGYAQMQSCMIYTKTQAREWLSHKLNERWRSLLSVVMPGSRIVAHLRHGDFKGYGYPMLSSNAFETAARYYCFDPEKLYYCREESPAWADLVPGELSFIPDFLAMLTAPVLLRANSSFSWVAGLLSDGIVLSPRIDGLQGGIEHDEVRFEVGNHCKLSDNSFCTDLHVSN